MQSKWFQTDERLWLCPLPVDEKSYQERDDEYVYSYFRGCEPVECFAISEGLECQQIGSGNDEHALSVHLLERDVDGALCVTEKTQYKQNGNQ